MLLPPLVPIVSTIVSPVHVPLRLRPRSILGAYWRLGAYPRQAADRWQAPPVHCWNLSNACHTSDYSSVFDARLGSWEPSSGLLFKPRLMRKGRDPPAFHGPLNVVSAFLGAFDLHPPLHLRGHGRCTAGRHLRALVMLDTPLLVASLHDRRTSALATVVCPALLCVRIVLRQLSSDHGRYNCACQKSSNNELAHACLRRLRSSGARG